MPPASLTMIQAHQKISAADMDAIEKMRAGKNEFVTLDPSLVSAIRKAGRDWAAKTAAEQTAKGNPWMERISASYFAFQDKWIAAAGHPRPRHEVAGARRFCEHPPEAA